MKRIGVFYLPVRTLLKTWSYLLQTVLVFHVRLQTHIKLGIYGITGVM